MRYQRIAVSFLFACCWLAFTSEPLPCEIADRPSPEGEVAAAADTRAPTGRDPSGQTAGRLGIRAFKDPATGRWTVPGTDPPGATPPPALPEGLSRGPGTSGRGLIERPGRSRAGGVRLPLEGRFRRALIARKGADGKLVLGCIEGGSPPEPAESPRVTEEER